MQMVQNLMKVVDYMKLFVFLDVNPGQIVTLPLGIESSKNNSMSVKPVCQGNPQRSVVLIVSMMSSCEEMNM